MTSTSTCTIRCYNAIAEEINKLAKKLGFQKTADIVAFLVLFYKDMKKYHSKEASEIESRILRNWNRRIERIVEESKELSEEEKESRRRRRR